MLTPHAENFMLSRLQSRISIRLALLATVGLSGTPPLAAASVVREHRAAPPAIPVITITATDYAFEMPARVDAGLVTFRLLNRGRELHHVFVARLKDPGLTPGNFIKQILPNAPFPGSVELFGGPNTPGLGGTSEVTIRLVPGTYVALCVFSDAKGTSHVGLGQSTTFTVTSNTNALPDPPTTATVTFNGYDFKLSAPIRAGAHHLRLVNNTNQPHELLIAKLKTGKKAIDVLGWMATRSPISPVEQLGGSTPLGPGHDVWVNITLTPGRYAIYCFMPDIKDGSAHLSHGSMKEFTVEGASPSR